MIERMFPTTEQFYLFVNEPFLQKRALVLGYTNVYLVNESDFSDELIEYLKHAQKAAVVLFYIPVENSVITQRIRTKLEAAQLDEYCVNLYDDWIIGDDIVNSIDDVIKGFFTPVWFRDYLVRHAIIYDNDHTGRCGHCHRFMDDNNQFCIYCGTKRGKGSFLPFKRDINSPYGTPCITWYVCRSCNHDWSTVCLGDEHGKYCPSCGLETASIIKTVFHPTPSLDTIIE